MWIKTYDSFLIPISIKRERPDNFELMEHWQGLEIHISSSRKQVVQSDGEMLQKIPSLIKIIPDAIKVFVPQKENKGEMVGAV